MPDPLQVHPYEPSKRSSVGNCWCGAHEPATVHPHGFRATQINPARCVCGLPPYARIHRERP